MKRQRTSIIVIILLALLLPLRVAAASGASISNVSAKADPKGVVTISGCYSRGPGHTINVRVIAPDGSIEYVDGTTSGAHGYFLFVNKLSAAKAGRYDVTIGADGVSAVARTYFDYRETPTDGEMADVSVKASIDKDNKVRVTGMISTGDGQQLTILIKDPGSKTDFVDHTISKNGGIYEFSYLMTNPLKGRYCVTVGATGSASPALTYFDYGTDADLKILCVSGQTLSPVFNPETTLYTIFTDKTAQSIIITAVPNDDKAKIRINGMSIESKTPSIPIELASGKNIITVEVTAQDGVTVKTYAILAEKKAATHITATVKAGISKNKRVSITGTISSGDGQQVTVKITDPANKVEYAGSTLSRNGGKYRLDYTMKNSLTGRYRVTIGADGMNEAAEAYFVYDPSNADLKSLSVLAVKLKPEFSPSVTEYSAEVYHGIGYTRIIPEANNEDQMITVNGMPLKSGEASADIPLSTGSNTVRILVTSLDGMKSKTYVIDINKQPLPQPPTLSGDANLSGLVINHAEYIDPEAFTSSITEYVAEISPEDTIITLIPTASDERARITVNGEEVDSGSASTPIAVTQDVFNVNIVVTAENGTTKAYIITIIIRDEK